MLRNKRMLKRTILAAAACLVVVLSSSQIKAAFSPPPSLTTFVEIDGVRYGAFDRIEGLEHYSNDGYPDTEGTRYRKISLSREFVTDPSLYLWAKNRMQKKMGLKDIHLITEDDSGQRVSHTVLQLCQPLSWSVESSNPSLGGFNEAIDFAVQKVTVF